MFSPFTAELYGIQTRSTVVVFLTSAGTLASLLAPQVNTLRLLYWESIPYIVYGLMGFLGALCVISMPKENKK